MVIHFKSIQNLWIHSHLNNILIEHNNITPAYTIQYLLFHLYCELRKPLFPLCILSAVSKEKTIHELFLLLLSYVSTKKNIRVIKLILIYTLTRILSINSSLVHFSGIIFFRTALISQQIITVFLFRLVL